MRRYPNSASSSQAPIKRQRGDWEVVRTLLPYLWTYKWSETRKKSAWWKHIFP